MITAAVASLLGVGCSSSDNGDSASDFGDDGSATVATMGTGVGPTGGPAGTANPTSDGSGPATTTGPTDGGPGDNCQQDENCLEGVCFDAGVLGGFCGECNKDGDCMGGGCQVPNPYTEPVTPSACMDGMLGDGCQSNMGCSGALTCTDFLVLPGVVTARTCSECELDMDCGMVDLCQPTMFNLGNLTGARVCVAPDSLANGELCDPTTGTADAACTNLCAETDLAGIVTVGVCSSCAGDGDCPGMNDTCVDPVIDFVEGTITAASCEAGPPPTGG